MQIFNAMKIYVYSLFLIGINTINAQVGINTKTPRTTLDIVATSTSSNTPEGLIAPNLTRAEVISKNNVYNQEQKGAFVYIKEISSSDILDAKTAKIINTGYYYFDGTIWRRLSYNTEQIYLPSFNLPLPIVTEPDDPNQEYDIYPNVYQKQFVKPLATAPASEQTFVSSNPNLTQIPDLYRADQLDYVITYYDNTIINDVSISANGILSYKVLNTNPSNTSFINIVLVVK